MRKPSVFSVLDLFHPSHIHFKVQLETVEFLVDEDHEPNPGPKPNSNIRWNILVIVFSSDICLKPITKHKTSVLCNQTKH